MSRVGRLPITIPSGVAIDVDGNHVVVTGPRGTLERDIAPLLSLVTEDGQLRVERPNDEKRARELHGLTRTLINNMVVGVTEGYRRGLEIQGVGYRAQLVGSKLQLNLGYSHPIEIEAARGHRLRGGHPHAHRRDRHRQGAGRAHGGQDPGLPQA